MDSLQVVELTQDNFQDTIQLAARPVLVNFRAPWCAPCRLMAPVVDALAEIFAGRLIVGKVNVDRHPALAAAYGVMSIPTLKLFVGGAVVRTWIGAHDQEQLVRELTKALRSQAAKS